MILRRCPGWPIDRFSRIEPLWSGQKAVVIASGPSLTDEQIALVREAKVPCIAINLSYLIAPFADVLYFADYVFWQWYHHEPGFRAFAGQKATIEGSGMLVPDPAVHMLRNYGVDGLSDRANGLHSGLNGGYQALNMAYLAGANPIGLIGYDMRFDGKRTHFHAGHPAKTPEASYTNYARHFHTALRQLRAHDVRVINCTPRSALTAFERGDLRDFLSEELQQSAALSSTTERITCAPAS